MWHQALWDGGVSLFAATRRSMSKNLHDSIQLAVDARLYLARLSAAVPPMPDGGLGVGLGLVRQIVSEHSGTVAARSQGPGRGSEFAVRLPLKRPVAPFPSPAV